MNIEYLIFTQINRIDISIISHSSRYSWHFLYQVMFYGPFSTILHFLSHNRARIEYRWYVSRFSFRWVAAATNYTRIFASIFLIISKSFNQGDITIDVIFGTMSCLQGKYLSTSKLVSFIYFHSIHYLPDTYTYVYI